MIVKRGKRPGRAFHRRRKHAMGRVRAGNLSPWFMKVYGSRPEYKRKRPMVEVA